MIIREHAGELSMRCGMKGEKNAHEGVPKLQFSGTGNVERSTYSKSDLTSLDEITVILKVEGQSVYRYAFQFASKILKTQ